MYTSNKRKTALLYLLAALFAAFFGAVYEQFSHGVYSNFMIYAFAFPLVGGTLPCLLLNGADKHAHPAAGNLWGAGIAALTVGSLFRGALEIYGTTSPLTKIYWIAGGLLLVASLLVWLVARAPAGRTHTKPLPEGGYESAHHS